uniref:Transposase (Putative), gypsy type n=1 Tax=Tanacetum cinerariifolium TaxID=118510 RepID=A0A6L2P6U3_TANCI|nr:hypothetical protein [Tanacetum cinerariifolium]
MGRNTVQLETAVNTISHEYLLEFTSEYGIPETLHPELPGPGDRIVDFPEGKVGNNRFFWVDERVFPTVVDWRTNASKDGMPAEGTYSIEAVRALDTHRTPIQKQPEMLLCLVGISRRYYLEDEVYDLFNLIRASNLTKVKIESRPRVPHEVPLLTLTANRVIEMDDPAAATDSSGVPSTIERSPLNFALEAEALDQGTVAPEMPPSKDVPTTVAPGTGQAEEVAAADPPAAAESRKRGRDVIDANAPPKSLRRDHADPRPTQGAPTGERVLLPYNWAWHLLLLCLKMHLQTSVTRIRCPLLTLRHALQLMLPSKSSQGIAAAGDPESENASSHAEVGSPEGVYRPEWGVTNGSLLDTPEACQDLVDHVAMGSQLRLRFEQKAKLLRKSVAQVARRDKRIQARELEIKNLEALLEAEANTKKATKDRSAGLSQELENTQKLKAAFEEFKRKQDERVEQRCAEMDALSIDFDEKLYPHMLTAIAGRRWVIGRGLHLAVMKCGESLKLRQAFADAVSARIAKGLSEGLRHGLEHGQALRSLESIEAYDPGVKAKFVAALQALKDLKYPLVDQLKSLKDASRDVIMAALYLESDTGDDASQDIRDLCPSSSQLTILVYPEVRDPQNPWACKEEIVLADAIAANISHAEKKKKCRIVCRTHGVGSAHHARSNGVPVFVPTVVLQGLALLLTDAATQTELEDDT